MTRSRSKATESKDSPCSSGVPTSLEESGISLADLIEGSIQGIAVLQRGRILYASPAFGEILGEPAESLVHARLEQFLTPASWKRLLMAARADRSAPVEIEARPRGRHVWLQARTRRVRWHGRDAVLLAVVDMTGRRDLERQLDRHESSLRDIINCASAAIFVKDLDRRYTIVNDAFCRHAGLPRDQIIGCTARDIFPDEALDIDAADDFVIRERKPTSLHELIVDRESGEHYLLFNKFPLFDSAGKLYAICGITTDVTELRLMERQLRHIQKLDTLGQLSGGFIHDFNNYLAIISGNLELALGATDPNSRMARYLGAAQSAARKSSRLTQRLGSFIKAKPVAPECLDTALVVRDLEALLQRTLDARHEFRVTCPHPSWHVFVDRSKLESALVNLAINGRDAMPEGGLLTLSVTNHNFTAQSPLRPAELAPGQYVEFAVTDTGIGMAPQVRKRAVEPFFTTKTGRHGLGLGLALVYRFVTDARGSMQIDSEPGKGTTIRLFLPRAAAPGAPQPQMDVSRSASSSGDR